MAEAPRIALRVHRPLERGQVEKLSSRTRNEATWRSAFAKAPAASLCGKRERRPVSHTGIELAVAPTVHRRITNEQSRSDDRPSVVATAFIGSQPIAKGRVNDTSRYEAVAGPNARAALIRRSRSSPRR